jgi:thymidine phosphorylase
MIGVLDVLQNNPCAPNDLREKAIYLASELMELCGIKSARKEAEEILSSGRAYKKFKEIINFQNGENDFEKRVSKLRPAKFRKTIYSPCDGRIVEMNDSKINSLCRILGTPESTSAGIFIHRNVGRISKSDRWFTIYAESMERLEEGMKFFKDNFFRIGNKIGI